MRKELSKSVKAIHAIKPGAVRQYYKIKGEKGLLLAIYPSGRRVWLVRYQVGKGAARKERTQEIGDLEHTPLAKACSMRVELRREAARGEDPRNPKTFGDLFQSWLDDYAKKKLKTWKDEEGRYALHLKSALGARLIDKIERKDVREIRDTVLEGSGPIQSNRVVALFNRVMNWAVDEDRAKFNPAARLKKVGEESRRERVLTPQELARLWAELDKPLAIDHEAGGITETDLEAAVAVRRATKLLIATGQRRGEVIGMAKAELDLTEGDAWWTIPAERTKNGLPHRVPLTATALATLKEAMEASGNSKFVFPSAKTKGQIRADAVTKQLQRMCRRMKPKIEGLGPHDIRRTVGTTMRKLGVSVEDRGSVFNHISGAKAKVTSWNYDAGEHDDEKRAALEKWERELRRVVRLDVAKVVALRPHLTAT